MTFKSGDDESAEVTDDLDPMAHLTFWNTLVIPESDKLDGIPKDMLQTDGLPPILDFKSVMQNLQKTIAIDHAKKVREGKESVNMNGQLREKYSDYNYHFPDRILNAGLSKKDFTAPFLIDVKQIKQDMGNLYRKDNTASSKYDELIRGPHGGDRTMTMEESKKRKEAAAGTTGRDPSIISASPTLYKMLEQPTPPASKRIKISPNAQKSLVRSNNSIRSNQTSVFRTSSLKPILPKQPSTQITIVKQNQSPTVTQNVVQPQQQQHRPGLKSAAITPSSRPKATVTITPKPSQQFVSIRPKLPVSVITPQRVVGQQQQEEQQKQGVVVGVPATSVSLPRENGVVMSVATPAPTDKEAEDDDFFPKIINTQGSVVMTKGTTTPENSNIQKNGAKPQPPKLIQIQPKKSVGATGEGNKILKDERQNTALEKREAVRGSGFLGCRHCGKTFPSNCDSLYRSHMIIKHSLEVTDAEILEAKIQVTSWYKCKKCALMVLNNLEEHHKKCLPNLPFEHAFDPIQVLTDDVPKLVCGLCSDAVDSRVNLRAHLQSKHPQFNNRILLDPFFRCGICLQHFIDSKKLIEHVKNCKAQFPSPETAQEIAQKNLFCEICNKKHAKIRETLFCYQVKSLLRCVLCMHVSQSRQNFFKHLEMYHDRRSVGLCCPFCNDHVEKPTRQAFDHFIDNHLNVALKRAGEAALARGRLAIAAQNSQNHTNNTNSNNTLGGMPRLTKPTVQVKRSLPTLKPKAIVPGTSQSVVPSVTVRHSLSPAAAAPASIQVPVSQIVQVSGTTTTQLNVAQQVVGNGSTFSHGTILARPVMVNRAQISQIPLQISVVPATNVQTITTAAPTTAISTNTTFETIEPEPPAASVTTDEDDSILGM